MKTKELPEIASIEGSASRDVIQVNFLHLIAPRPAINAVSRLLRENKVFANLDMEDGVITTTGSMSYPLDAPSETYRFGVSPLTKTIYLLRTKSSETFRIYDTLIAADRKLHSQKR